MKLVLLIPSPQKSNPVSLGTGQLPPPEIVPQVISPWTIGAQTIAPQNN